MSATAQKDNDTETEESPVQRVTTVDAWARKADHNVVLATGAEVVIRLPNLPEMLQAGAIPNELQAIAVKVESQAEITVDDLLTLGEFNRFLVSKALVDPKVTPDEIAKLPTEDVTMLIEIATRQRDTDALGRQIAGLDKTAEYRNFREQSLEFARLLGESGLGTPAP